MSDKSKMNRKHPSKGNKNNSKGHSKFDKGNRSSNRFKSDGTSADVCTHSGPINDASYYFWDDNLKRQISNISFNQFNGVPNSLGVINRAGNKLEAYDLIPYAMRIELSPSPGFTTKEFTTIGNGINLAALNLYTTLSANNAKTTNYAPQDLTTLMLAIGSVIECASTITRAFGLTYLYNQRNRAYPQGIVTVAGFDYADLVSKFADYRARFNTIMASANKIPIPANIPYFKKCSDIYSGIYLDMEGSDMAQTYVFTPGTLWLFNEEYSEAGTGLETIYVNDTSNTTNIRTMDWYLTFLDLMVGSLLNSTTLNSIYSDILRVATKENMSLYSFDGVSESYVVYPAYVPEIRRWINNATILGYPLAEVGSLSGTKGNDVLPNVEYNRIDYQPIFSYSAAGMDADFYMNFDSSNPTSDEIIEATRLAARLEIEYDAGSSTYYSTSAALPDHYVNRLIFFGDDTDPLIVTSSVESFVGRLPRALVNFDWHPAIYNSTSDTAISSYLDLNYYTTLDFDYVKRLQDMTYLGLFTLR